MYPELHAFKPDSESRREFDISGNRIYMDMCA